MNEVHKVLGSECISFGDDIEYIYQLIWNGVLYEVSEVIILPEITYGEMAKFHVFEVANSYFLEIVEERKKKIEYDKKECFDIWYEYNPFEDMEVEE